MRSVCPSTIVVHTKILKIIYVENFIIFLFYPKFTARIFFNRISPSFTTANSGCGSFLELGFVKKWFVTGIVSFCKCLCLQSECVERIQLIHSKHGYESRSTSCPAHKIVNKCGTIWHNVENSRIKIKPFEWKSAQCAFAIQK